MSGTRAAELHRLKDGIELDIADKLTELTQLFIELSRVRFEILVGASILWTEVPPRDRTIKLDLPEAA